LMCSGAKLGQVASEALDVRGKAMRRALAAGETDAEKMSHLARRLLKRQQPQWQQALDGRLTEAQRWVLGQLLDQYDQSEAALARVEERLTQEGERSLDPFVPEAVKLLDTILSGVGF
jgi:ubiquinone biosynthesis protein UbiJ